MASSSSSSSSSANNYMRLLSSDEQLFTVAIPAAMQSGTLQKLIEDGYPTDPVPIFNANAQTLSRVIMYLEKHVDESLSSNELADFDAGFVDLSSNDIYDLIQAANYLDVPSLLSLLKKKVASLIEGKTFLEIRQMLNIRNSGFTREEEAAISMKLSWILRR